MLTLDDAHRLFRYAHAGVGFAGLLLLLVPLFATKGGRVHVVGGRIFAWCAYFVGCTGLAASVWGVLHPASFLGSAEFRALGEMEARLAAERVRVILSITGFLALAVLEGTVLGTRIMRAGDRHERVGGPLVAVLLAALLGWSAGLAIYAGVSLIAAYAGWHFVPGAAAHRYWIGLVLGLLGVYGAIGDWQYVRGPVPSAAERRAMHIECMVGAGAGFYAAFFFFGATRVFELPGFWVLAAPLIPLVAGMALTRLWQGRVLANQSSS